MRASLRTRSLPVAATLLALAACNGDSSTQPGDEFVANRVVARVQKSESKEELKLDAPLTALHLSSALDPARAFTLLLGGNPLMEELQGANGMGPMLQLVVPGPLAVRSYPVGTLDISESGPAEELTGLTSALGVVAVPEPDGDDVDFFTTTGGSVEVVRAELGSGNTSGHVRARVELNLREFYFDRQPAVYGKQATGRGSLDGPLMHALASDAELSFTGAFTGSTRRDLMDGPLYQSPEAGRSWHFGVQTAARGEDADFFADLTLRLSRIPSAGETVHFGTMAPDTLPRRGPSAADTVSSAMLQTFDGSMAPDTLEWGGVSTLYLSTSGELRVETATPQALRGTLILTLTEYDLRTRRFGTRTVTASGRVGLSMMDVPPVFNRAPAIRPVWNRARARR